MITGFMIYIRHCKYPFQAEGIMNQGGFGMKKTVIVLLVLFVPASLWAMDINQGKFELSGQTAFNISKTNLKVTGLGDTDITNYKFELDGHYYFIKNLGLGLFLAWDRTETDAGDTSTLIIGPQLTYNIPLNEKISLFVNGGVGYATATIEDEDVNGFVWQVGGGLKYFITNSVSMNGTVHYQSLNLEKSGIHADTSGVNFGVGLSVYF